MGTAEHIIWHYKVMMILAGLAPEVTAKDFEAALPTIEEMIIWVNAGFSTSFFHSMCTGMNIFTHTAEACEQLGMYDEALMFAQAATNSDITKGGSFVPSHLSDGFQVKGRCLASMGKAQAAEEAFESALANLSGFGLHLLEVLVLRDLKVYILDKDGRSDEGSNRLKASIHQLLGTSPAAEQLAELQVALGPDVDIPSVLA